MSEVTGEFLQGQLALLRRLYEQGKFTPEEYRAEIARLGVDPATIVPPSPPPEPDLSAASLKQPSFTNETRPRDRDWSTHRKWSPAVPPPSGGLLPRRCP